MRSSAGATASKEEATRLADRGTMGLGFKTGRNLRQYAMSLKRLHAVAPAVLRIWWVALAGAVTFAWNSASRVGLWIW